MTVTSGGVDRRKGYERMGVQEVWFWEDGTLEIFTLHDGAYAKVGQSDLLPALPFELFCRYIMTYYD